MNKGIQEIKVVKWYASIDMEQLSVNLNSYLKEGWVILDISTAAPEYYPGGSGSRDNYFVYHLGRPITEEKKQI